jgi:hypothetical protein
MSTLDNDTKLLLTRAMDYLNLFFSELRGDESSDREWSELEYEVADIIAELQEKTEEMS